MLFIIVYIHKIVIQSIEIKEKKTNFFQKEYKYLSWGKLGDEKSHVRGSPELHPNYTRTLPELFSGEIRV